MSTGYYIQTTKIKDSASPIDNVTKFAWDNDDYETIEEWHEYTEEELAAQEGQVTIEDLMQAVAELGALVESMEG